MGREMDSLKTNINVHDILTFDLNQHFKSKGKGQISE